MPYDATIGRRIGVTDQYLRVWRLILFNENTASLAQGDWAHAPALLGATSSVSIFSSEQNTGQYPGQETYASGLRIAFTVTQGVTQTPNTAEITIYNLDDRSVNNLIEEYNYVILQAGYEWGNAGTIFTGTVKLYKKGHESVTDSYLKLYCADGDQAINGAIINTKLDTGTTPQAKVKALTDTMADKGVSVGLVEDRAFQANIPPGIRPETLYGVTADEARDYANANGAMWHVLNQQFYWAKPQSYDPGDVVQMTSLTGLVGFPEITQEGLNFTALINPNIRLRQRVHLDNSLINQYFTPGGASGTGGGGQMVWLSGAGSQTFFASVSADGIYTPLHINYSGDSRGQEWFMYCVCLAVDSSQDNALFSLLGAFDWNSLT